MPLMEAGNQALSIAHAIKRKKKMAQGGEVKYPVMKDASYASGGMVDNEKLRPSHEGAKMRPSVAHILNESMPMNMAKAIRAKRMAAGGLVASKLHDDWLSAEEDDEDQSGMAASDTYPDPDGTEHESYDEDPELRKKTRLSRVMEMIHARHKGY